MVKGRVSRSSAVSRRGNDTAIIATRASISAPATKPTRIALARLISDGMASRLEHASSLDENEAVNKKLVMLTAMDVPAKVFLSVLKSSKFGACAQLYEGSVWITEVPGPRHGRLNAIFTDARMRANNESGSVSYRPIVCTGKRTLTSPRSVLLPDNSFYHHSNGSDFPAVVVEIADSEGTKDVDRKAQLYLSLFPLIRMVIAVTVMDYEDGTRGGVFIVYRPGPAVDRGYGVAVRAVTAISFGDALHNRTRDAVLDTGVPGADFTGVGRPGGAACNALGVYVYAIPNGVWGVVPEPALNMYVDMYDLNQNLYL